MATYYDRIAETSTSTGTSTFTLAGASTTYQSFSAVGNGNATYYAIVHQSANEWEIGTGTWSTGGTLSRTTIYAGSNGTSAVNFSAGTKDVFQPCPATHLNTIPIANGGTGQSTAANAWRALIPAGIMEMYAGSSAPVVYLECDGAAVSRTTYAALFAAISTTWGAGDGSTTFNLPDLAARVPMGRGTPENIESCDAANVDTTQDTWDVAVNTCRWLNGQRVQVSTTGSLPGGLSAATNYYIIRWASNKIKFATSVNNALAGTQINLTSQGSGTHTLTEGGLNSRTLGQIMGSDSHYLTTGELATHTHIQDAHTHTQNTHSHTYGNLVSNTTTGGGGNRDNLGASTYANTSSVAATNQNTTATNQNTGNNENHNNVQMSAVVMFIISTGGV